ncbi:MAG: hypothetical protein GEV06_19720 [Luteitalea sp.]|nr:hypothetical protein [Luteitalea sp.]
MRIYIGGASRGAEYIERSPDHDLLALTTWADHQRARFRAMGYVPTTVPDRPRGMTAISEAR